MQGCWWNEKRLKAWLLERDLADGKMYYVDGPRDPKTGREVPIPANGALSYRTARRDRYSRHLPSTEMVPRPQTQRRPQPSQAPIPDSAFMGVPYGFPPVAQPVMLPVQSLTASPAGNEAFVSDVVSYTSNHHCGYHNHQTRIPPTWRALHISQCDSVHSSTSSTSSAYMPSSYGTTSLGYSAPRTPYVPKQKSTAKTPAKSTMPAHPRTRHYETRMPSRDEPGRLGPNNAGANQITVLHLDAKSGIKDLRLCFQRDMHFLSGEFRIKPGKSKKGKGKVRAYVTFDRKQLAEQAVKSLNGANIGSNKVNVMLSKSRQGTVGSSRNGNGKASRQNGGPVSRKENKDEPIIIDGSIRD
ncbi:MAG: hypothetical protein Q9163_000823 [Psora crenata]